MKFTKNLALMGIGAGAVLAYQKYSKPMMKKVDHFMNSKMKKVDNAREDMM